ncbi:MAG: hypothetical protein WKF52_08910 [Sphingomicrobium sp.]
MAVPKVTTPVACRIAGLNRDRFNEYVAAGHYGCAPRTVPGRARLFDPDDMLTLFLFKRLLDDGYTVERAGTIACAIGEVAKLHPEARAVSYVESYFRGGHAHLASDVPAPETWDDVLFSGTDIRAVTTFRIGKERDLVAHYTEEERSIIGDPETDD